MSNILTNNINPRSGNLITIGGTNDKVSIAGTLTYEDVANIDSVGIITAREGLDTPTNLVLRTGGTERVRIDSSGNFGIGTTSPGANLELGTVGGSDQTIRINSGGNGYLELFADGSLNKLISGNAATGSASLSFETSSGGTENEAMRIDSSGRLLVGTSSARTDFYSGGSGVLALIEGTSFTKASASITRNSNDSADGAFVFAKSRGTSNGGVALVNADDSLGEISWQGADGVDMVRAARIRAEVDGTPGANDMPGRLAFYTTADGASSPTERMRITNDGKVRIGNGLTSAAGELFQVIRDGGGQGTNDCLAYFETGQNDWIQKLYYNASGTAYFFDLQQQGTRRGRVFYDGTMNYSDGSDYRLKENVVPLANAIDRVKQLQPCTYNFIEHGPEKEYDGFLAHELAEVCPYAVKGEKDAVNEDGSPDIQMVDRSHVIPLLAAALQEAITKIETLEQRLTDAGL